MTAIALSWITIFFVEYGPYFNRDYQESVFKGFAWDCKGVRNDYISVEIDGESYWNVDSTVDFTGKTTYGSRVISEDANGNGVACKIEGGDTAMHSYKSINGKLDVDSEESLPLISAEEFAKMVICVDLPVEEMSFKPKMENISVFKKDNALVSQAAMPTNNSYFLNVAGWDESMKLTGVSLYNHSYPWNSNEEGENSQTFTILGYNAGRLVEIDWKVITWLN